MKVSDMRYSPQAPASYGWGPAGMLAGDPEAWNLAWLSHPVEWGPHPDPNFSTLIRRTLQFVIDDGVIDLIDAYSDSEKVRGFLRMPAAQAVLKITSMAHLVDTPLFSAYGSSWTDTLALRSRQYRAPYHSEYDHPALDLTQALAVIDLCK
jgi:hypothetical protein